MSRYEIYKPSGIDWIGEIPKDWNIKRLKEIANVETGNTPSTSNPDFYSEEGIPWIKPDNLNDFIELTDSAEKLSENGIKEARVVRKGAVLVCCIGTIGKIGIAGCDLATNQQINSVEFYNKRILDNYGKYLLYISEPELVKQSNKVVVSILNKIKQSQIKFPIPSIEEQLTIANYLDDQTQKIDRLIANKKAQAEKLKELRQIEINNAVTKGLNPNAEMKDSGIEWLGKIPKHWEKRKIATNFQIIGSGTTPDAGNEEYYDETGKYYFVNTGDLKDCEIYDCEKKITEEAFTKFTSLKLFPVNTLLIAMYGATIGKVGILKTEATTNQACCALANSYRFNIDYMFFFFIGIREDIIRLSYGGGQPNISQDTIKQLRIPCPPKGEQLEIVDHLQKRTTAIDQLIKNIEAQIEKLQELRKIKIYEAVTGKICLNQDLQDERMGRIKIETV